MTNKISNLCNVRFLQQTFMKILMNIYSKSAWTDDIEFLVIYNQIIYQYRTIKLILLNKYEFKMRVLNAQLKNRHTKLLHSILSQE